MKRIKVMRLSLLSSFLLISLAVLLVFGFSVQAEHMVKAEPVPQLDDQVLEEKAIVAAQQADLQGLPTAKRVVHMTLAEWLKLNGAELGKDAAQFALSRDMRVYVLAMRGSVISQLPVFPRPGQEGLQAP